NYVTALIEHVPSLAAIVKSKTSDTIVLTNRAVIRVFAASYRGTRGYKVAGVVCDEIAFWRDESSANPDKEILAALRGGMLRVPGALLVAISSPYARRGELYATFKQYWGREGDVLVWKADSRTMNPTISGADIAREYERDPSAARAEYGASFRDDVESYLSRDIADSMVIPRRIELPPVPGIRYFMFVDLSGGGSDSMTAAVSHWDVTAKKRVLDAVLEFKPLTTTTAKIVEAMANMAKRYGVHEIYGDGYAGEWPRERFREHGIS